MKIAVACDHGGLVLKDKVIEAITEAGCTFTDYGTFSCESCDYPDYALKAAEAVAAGICDKGVLLCGTGIGISIAANKVKTIRCGHVTDVFSAAATAEHNNANMIALGGRITTPDDAKKIVSTYLSTTFAGGRHQTRIDKIKTIEDKYFK